jgi:hypothetical protein
MSYKKDIKKQCFSLTQFSQDLLLVLPKNFSDTQHVLFLVAESDTHQDKALSLKQLDIFLFFEVGGRGSCNLK